MALGGFGRAPKMFLLKARGESLNDVWYFLETLVKTELPPLFDCRASQSLSLASPQVPWSRVEAGTLWPHAEDPRSPTVPLFPGHLVSQSLTDRLGEWGQLFVAEGDMGGQL